MQNVTFKQNGSKLTIEVDLSKRYGKSSTGKTTIIASTQGNQTVNSDDGPVFVGVNVYTKE